MVRGAKKRVRQEPRPVVVFVMGPPGSGKSTQAQALREQFGLERVKTGTILRKLGRGASALNRHIKERIDAGRLAPPPLVSDLVIRDVRRILAKGKGIVFDGSPRTLHEAELLLGELKHGRSPRVLVVFLDVPQPETARRIVRRWVCEDCALEAPSGIASPEMCIACGGKVRRRDDDRAAVAEERWEEYNFRTLPVVQYLDRRGLVTRVNGDRPIPAVTAEVEQRVAAFLKSSTTGSV